MPMYLNQPVTDDYLQRLIEAYRDGQRDAGHPVEDGDDIILDRLSANGVLTAKAPSAYDLGKLGE